MAKGSGEMESSMKQRSKRLTKMNIVPLPGMPDVAGALVDTGDTHPRLFGKCAGKTYDGAVLM
jgi:hypothetical protein